MSTIRIEVQGQTFETALPGRPVTIGSAEGVDLKLDCEGVSSRHAVIDLLPDGRHRVKDLGSGNATRVNGVGVQQISLSAGDAIQIGAARITFLGGEPAAPEPIPAAIVEPQPTGPPVRAEVAKPVPVKTVPAKVPAASVPSAKTTPVRAVDPAADVSDPSNGSSSSMPTRTRARGKQSRLVLPLVVVAIMAGAAIVLSNMAGDENDANLGRARQQFEAGRDRLDEKDFEGARAIFQALADDPKAGEFRRKAETRLDHIRKTEGQLVKDLAALTDQGLNYNVAALNTRRDLFIDDYGDANVHRYDVVRDMILAIHSNWTDINLKVHRQETQDLVDERQFAAALEGWRDFGRAAPPAVDLGPEVGAGLALVQIAALESASQLVAAAEKLSRRNGPTSAGRFLSDRIEGFRGTQAELEIRAGIDRYAEAAASAAATAPPTRPDDMPPTRPEDQPPTRPEDVPPTVPTTPEHETRAKAALESAATAISVYQFEDARSTLSSVHAALPEGEWKQRIGHWLGDLALADAAFTALIADIPANRDRYKGVRLGTKLRASLVDADRATIATLVRGGTSKFKWTRVTPALMADFMRRMKVEGDRALEAAALLHLIGGRDEGEATLYVAGLTGAATDKLFPILARWRGESMPADGYVVHDERYVTVERRDFLVLEAKIADALLRIDHDDAKERAGAYKELLAIGEPAEDRFRTALETRRGALIEQIAHSKSFRSSKNKNKLFQQLQQRRRNALALIYDAAAYPYPNPNKKNQKRVEELVDLVREIWERPFDLVTQWDKKLKDELLVVTEVDEVLAEIDPGYKPDLDVIKDRINQAIDMPSHNPGSREAGDREYSLKALKYNEELQCTGTPQEKDNTLIVNEYRMMMGLRAVKINERLLRASRGHSKHMREKKYFAHDVPAPHATPQNKSPGTRARTQGYGGGVGENIATGPGTGRGAFWAWFGSSGHHRNMLGRGWTEMGCGRAGRYWTQLFGAAGGYGLNPPAPLPDPDPPFAPEDEAPPRKSRGGRLPGDRGLFDED